MIWGLQLFRVLKDRRLDLMVFTALGPLRRLKKTSLLKTTKNANPHNTLAKNSPTQKPQINSFLHFLLCRRHGPLGRPFATVFGNSFLQFLFPTLFCNLNLQFPLPLLSAALLCDSFYEFAALLCNSILQLLFATPFAALLCNSSVELQFAVPV